MKAPGVSSARPLLIVSASGRALAASAARAGIPVVVLDLFNDRDTKALAVASRSCAGPRLRLQAHALLRAARELCPPEACAGLVYGSALESRPRLIARLARGRTLYGNAPETVSFVKDPARFFPLLDSLRIPHPEVRLDAPADRRDWLVKAIGGGGGGHVRRASARHRASAHRYFQRQSPGVAMSVLFAANGSSARIIGFNEQWAAGTVSGRPYLYGGAASRAPVASSICETVDHAVRELTASLGLCGLNGLDFLVDEECVCVLELNPRPPATIDLYDEDAEQGLLAVHLAACLGTLPELRFADRSRAHAIVYAPDTVRVPRNADWPAWCTDLPQSGSVIHQGSPVCTVHAEGQSSAAARKAAIARRAEVMQLLWRRAA